MAPYLNGDAAFTPSVHHEKIIPIAVVGIGWRGPGDALNVEKFYKMLAEAREARAENHNSKWKHDAFYHPDSMRKGTNNVSAGHYFIEDLSLFDAPFFNMTNAEAAALDPQQRLLLETCYEALENSGTPIEKAAGSETSVFVATFGGDYTDTLQRDPDSMPSYQATNSGHSRAIVSNRLSHFFDFRGTSVTVDTACSGGLTAFHLACQSIRTGDARQAICGGSSVILSPDLLISLSGMGFLSPDGRCYSFDERANGYARGEGVGCILLKRLDDALADGDTIRAIVRNSGSNQDGRTPGISFPSKVAQEMLTKGVYTRAGLDPLETSYVEAHGTGTQAGDPIETSAISAAIAVNRPIDKPLIIGSVKANIGHLEGASGIAGLIKCILMLENEVIFPNRNFQKANSRIPLEAWRLKVPLAFEPWRTTGPHRLSINSFGYGGTNASAVLESASDYLRIHGQKQSPRNTFSLLAEPSVNGNDGTCNRHNENVPGSPRWRVLLISAFDEAGVKRQVKSLSMYIKDRLHHINDEFLDDLAYTLNTKRSIFNYIAIISASSASDLIEALEDENLAISKASQKPRLGFVFTGQGAQYAGMGKGLLESFPVYAKTIRRCRDHLKTIGAPWDLLDELSKNAEDSRIGQAMFSQPACSAVQIALIELLTSWGIRPVSVTGHSSGELASAYAAEVLSLEDAMTSAYYRGIFSHIAATKNVVKGSMMVVGLGKEEVQPYLSSLKNGQATVACENSPASVTISGDAAAIDELGLLLEEKQIFTRKLNVEAAYHSHHMNVVGKDYLDSISKMETKRGGKVEFFSSVTGEKAEYDELGPEYWLSNMLGQVKFATSLSRLCHLTGENGRKDMAPSTGVEVLIEIGPHSALAGPIKQIIQADAKLKERSIHYMSALVRKKDATKTMVDLAANLRMKGFPIDLFAVNGFTSNKSVLADLPPYAWNKSTSHWAESRLSKAYRNRPHARIDLLGAPDFNSNALEPRWRNLIRSTEIPWVKDHKIQSNVVYPAAGYIAMALEAIKQQVLEKISEQQISGYKFREISIGQALIIPEKSDEVETMVTLKPHGEGTRVSSDLWHQFFVYSVTGDNRWTEHCRGLMSIQKRDTLNEIDGTTQTSAEVETLRHTIADMEGKCTAAIDVEGFYETLRGLGLDYGPTFANMKSALVAPCQSGPTCQCVAEISIADTAAVMPSQFQYPFVLHPSTLDSIFHPLFVALGASSKTLQDPMVPVFLEELLVSANLATDSGHQLTTYTSTEKKDSRQITASMKVVNTSQPDEVIIRVKGMICKSLANNKTDDSSKATKNVAYKFHWEVDPFLIAADNIEELCVGNETNAEEKPQSQILEQASLCYLEQALASVSIDDLPSSPQIKLFHGWAKNLVDNARQKEQLSSVDKSALILKTRGTGPEGKLLHYVGEHLCSIITGKSPIGSILAETPLLDVFFEKSPQLQRSYQQTAKYLTLLSNHNPHLKVLELGPGAGNPTLPILQGLGGAEGSVPKFAKYDIVNTGKASFEPLKERLASWADLMEEKSFNAEDIPEKQGFEEGIYDVVIAVYLSLGPDSIDAMIKNISRVLTAGGTLILIEGNRNHTAMTTAFGTLPGWWLGGITQPKLQHFEDKWQALLLENRFSKFSAIFRDAPEPDNQNAVMISRTKIEEEKSNHNVGILVITENDKCGIWMVRLLKALSRLNIHVGFSTMANANPAGQICIVLSELSQSFLHHPTETQFETIKNIFLRSSGVLWAVRGASEKYPLANMVTGVSRTARSETSDVAIITLDIDDMASEIDATDSISVLFNRHFVEDPRSEIYSDTEYMLKDGRLLIPRLVPNEEVDQSIKSDILGSFPEDQTFVQPDRPLRLEVGRPGLLDTMHFVNDEEMVGELLDDCVEIEVRAVGFNFRDVMMAMGQIAVETLGGECSGVVTAVGKTTQGVAVGDRVACVHLGTFCNFVRPKASIVQKIPDDMTFEVGASLPVVYCTASYSLFHVANLREGESVLVHAASGGLGQAMIQLCQIAKARIFATVGSKEKKQLLMESFGIPEDHIFSSRDGSFSEGVMRMTDNRGVDVVVNSLAGEALRLTWSCVAPFGRFVELGKRDFFINSHLEMAKFAKNVTFAAVDLVDLIRQRTELVGEVWSNSMKLIRDRTVKPPAPITVFSMAEIEKGLKIMQAGRHMGKLVAVSQSNELVKVIPAKPKGNLLKSDGSYLLVGGLGGLGRAIALWMVHNGARNLIFANRSGDTKQEAKDTIEVLRKEGAVVQVYACDVAEEDQLKLLIRESSKGSPPIRGVIQSAMVLKDNMLDKMTVDEFNAVTRPKVQGTLNLHSQLPRNLDFFIMLSSVSGIIGNASQAAYAGANTFLDSFAAFRNSLGLPAITIDLGVILGIGHVAESRELAKAMKRQGFESTQENELMALLKSAIRNPRHGGSQSHIVTGMGTWSTSALRNFSAPLFSHFRRLAQRVPGGDANTATSLKTALSKVDSLTEATSLICSALVAKVSALCMVLEETISPTKPVTEYGIDSLVAVEMRNWVFLEMDCQIAILELMANQSIESLAEKIASRSKLVKLKAE